MKVNAVGKEYSEAELAYFAGFLDADGAIMATIERHQEKKFGFRVRIALKITQRDKRCLNWFLDTFKIGYIRKNRGTFDWLTRDQRVINNTLVLLLPYLKNKRNQAEIALEIIKTDINSKDDLIKVANLADSLSRFNVRSKNRRKNYVSMI